MIFTHCTPFITVSQKRDINVFCRKKLVILMYRQSPEIFFMPLLRHIWQYIEASLFSDGAKEEVLKKCKFVSRQGNSIWIKVFALADKVYVSY